MAILIAIAIPIFTNQLERANEATDAANLRSAYATASASVLTENTKASGVSAGPVVIKQTGAFDKLDDPKVGTFDLTTLSGLEPGDELYVNVAKDGTVTIGDQNTDTGWVKVDPTTGISS